MKVKVVSCSNSILWYSQHIGEEFEVRYLEDGAYWTREKIFPFALNWIYAKITDGNLSDE